jgi:hypothetical protein
MDKNKELSDSIAFCGLICRLCFLSENCYGCKTRSNNCDRNCSVEGCYQKICCERKNLSGCWECNEIYGCEQGIYSSGNYSKVKAFAICIKEDGIEIFIDNIVKNMQKGWSVEKGKDYDNKTIDKVLKMIRNNI